MEDWGEWKFSSKGEDFLNEICSKLNSENVSEISSDWLALLNYNNDPVECSPMEVDVCEPNSKEAEICNIIKESLEGETTILETTFIGISFNSMSRILSTVKSEINEFEFCSFCKSIACWSYDSLIELALTVVVLPKLKETPEASSCVTFAIKELVTNKPNQFCQNVLIPLMFSDDVLYTDVELLSRIFPVLPTSHKDMIIMSFSKKTEFVENDWLLLYPLIKDLSQNSLLILLECIQKFSSKFTKSMVFGRFLVNFCKNLDIIGSKDTLREVIVKHETLLKAQALKYLELV